MPSTLPNPVTAVNNVQPIRMRHPIPDAPYHYGMGIGSRLRQVRIEMGLEVAEVARATGIKVSTLYGIENESQKSTTKLHRICAFYGINPLWAETGRGEKFANATPSGAQLVESDQIGAESAGLGMASMAREVLEVALLLTTIREPLKSHIIATVKAAVQSSQSQSQPDSTIPKTDPKSAR
jgi:transcriptional regulator with XRE-family HTH domain